MKPDIIMIDEKRDDEIKTISCGGTPTIKNLPVVPSYFGLRRVGVNLVATLFAPLVF